MFSSWVMVVPASILERHLVSNGSAMPIYRGSQERRQSSPNPAYRFDNDVPYRLREPCFIPKTNAKRQFFFTLMSLHINNHYAKKRGIGKKLLLTVRIVMLQEHVDMVAGDFNCAAWRRQSSSDPRSISIIEEAFANTDLPVPPGPTPLWRPGGVRGESSDMCAFFKAT